MLPVVDLRGSDRDPAELLPRAPAAAVQAARAAVRDLVADVAARGDAAVAEAARRFDGVEAPPAAWRATAGELAAAEDALGPELRAALADAIERVHAFHLAQRPTDLVWTGRPGVRLAQRFVPLRRAGVYAPGGLAAYPSSVVMNVVPAQAAGVEQVALATPPGPGGRGHAAVLGAAALLGVEEVWLLGGAQAVAALAMAATNIVLSVILASRIGVAGVVWGSVIAYSACTLIPVALYLPRLFARLGALRLARTVCSVPTKAAATGLYGRMAGIALSDYAHSKLIIIWGVNPSVSGIHLLPHLLDAQKRGARLVVVDPRRPAGLEHQRGRVVSPE